MEILATRDQSKLSLLAYNHNVPAAEINTEEISISVKDVWPDRPISISRIDQDNANPKQKWLELGSPEYPTSSELVEIEKASRVIARDLPYEHNEEGITLNFLLPSHGVVSITINTAP